MNIKFNPRMSFLSFLIVIVLLTTTTKMIQLCDCFAISSMSTRTHNTKQQAVPRSRVSIRSTSIDDNMVTPISSSSSSSSSRSMSNNTKSIVHSDDKKNNIQHQQMMTFIGTRHVITEPIVIPTLSSNQLLHTFFTNDNNRNLLFPNNNAVSLNLLEYLTAKNEDSRNNYNYDDNNKMLYDFDNNEIINRWRKEAQLGGGEGPTIHDITSSIIQSTSSSNYQHNNNNNKLALFKIDALLQMPGLKITSQSTIGMKLIFNNDYPEYQFTLLDSELIPNGPKPIVWLFNKLTKYRDSTSSFTKVRVERVTNHSSIHFSASTSSRDSWHGDSMSDEETIVFVTDARLETRMHLPPKLLKVLPNVNIAKFEKQGSEAVQKLLEKELEPALYGFRDAFCKFMERSTTRTRKSDISSLKP